MRQLTSQENKAFYAKVFSLTIPLALQNLINVAVTAADTVMLGKVSEVVLSGASLAGQVQYILTLFFFGITSGAAVLTAQYWGKRDIRTIEKIIAIALDVAISLSLVFSLAAFLIPEKLMHIYSSDPAVIETGSAYLKIISLSYVISGITMIYLYIMKSVERVVISTVVYCVSLVVNIVLNAILIFGLFGAPALGIRGAAIGTLVARSVELVITVFYAKVKNKEIKVRIADMLHPDKVLMKEFFYYAVPVTLNEFFWGLATSANTAIIAQLSTPAAAANSVAQVARQLATVAGYGVSSAAAIILGKTIGEGREDLAEIYAHKLIRVSLIFGFLGGLCIFLARGPIISFMGFTAETSEYLTLMLFVMFYYTVAQTYNTNVIVGVLRSGGDTRFGLILDFVAMWGCSVPLGFIAAFVLKLDPKIVYLILTADEMCKVPFTRHRWRKMGWLKNITHD